MQVSLLSRDVGLNSVSEEVGVVPKLLELRRLVKLVPLFGVRGRRVRFGPRGGARLTDTVDYTADQPPPKAHRVWWRIFLMGCPSEKH